MGNAVSRIEREFILNSVCDNEIPLKLSGAKVRSSGMLDSVEDDIVIISGDDDLPAIFPRGSEIRAYFSYYGHVMTFVSRVVSTGTGTVEVEIPDSIHKNLTRKYERVPPPVGVSISFTLQAAKIDLNFPKSEEFNPVDEPKYSDEYDMTDIQTLISAFRVKVQSQVTTNTVTMYRGRAPRGLEEILICQTGKILFIPDTSGNLPENDFEWDGRIITRAMLLRQERVSADETVMHDRLPALMKEKREKGIVSEIYCPIVYHEYVVGFIYLARKGRSDQKFDRSLLEETDQFAKILSYALKHNGYFEDTVPERSEYSGDILDISASGLLIANNSETLEKTLALYSDVDIHLRFGPRSMKISSRIMRKLTADSMNFYGIQFMEIKPEDFRFLFDFVYGRNVTSDDEVLWEGGADPPPLDFD